MSRILITSIGSSGDVYPYLAIARGLALRGHQCVIAMPEYYRKNALADGHEFRPIRPDVNPSDGELVARVMHRSRGPEVIIRELLMEPLRDTYADLLAAADGVDMIVTHPITFAGPIVAEKLKLRWASTVLAPLSFFSIYDLPVFPPAPWMIHLRKLGPTVSKMLVGTVKLVTRNWTKAVRELRAEVGVPDRGDPLYEGQHSPQRVLALFSKVLATPQRDWPANTIVTGYPFYDHGGDLPDKLSRFLDAGEPPVVFTLGTSAVMAPGDFYHESLNAVRSLGVRAVFLVGSDPANIAKEALPDGVIVVDYVSHAKLFPRAAAIVHHGGIGTTGEALRSGRPMLIVPHSHDQPDNGFRVKSLRVGETLPAHKYTSKRAMRQLLVALSHSERAAQVGKLVRSEDGVAAACDAIERLLAREHENGR